MKDTSTLPTTRQHIEEPLLEILSDGETYKTAVIVEKLAIHFQLTPAQRSETIPSGANRFHTRCRYAILELKIKGLIESPERGYWKII